MSLAIQGLSPAAPGGGRRAAAARLDVGLVNNMPDGALRAAERQFARRLAEASGTFDVRLHLFALDGVPRSAAARHHLRGRYASLDDLGARRLDALIVTGAEPSAPSLTAEPCWDGLARLVDWAEGNTVSAIWSCLAAHAAVLHLDGIARRRLPAKRFGLFDCRRVDDDGLFSGAPDEMRFPHSRWHDLAEGDLRRRGYRIASRSAEAGVDAFTKQWGSLFLFLQGHPEYDRDTLFREYRRDARRFEAGADGRRPELPSHCLDAGAAEGAARDAGPLGAPTPGRERAWTLRADRAEAWDTSASRLYANWLGLVASRR